VLILLTNDDGVYAPGLAALERQLRRIGELCVVAPAAEQSGVGHSITYLTPLIVKEVFHGKRRWGWAVEGSPADCVKLGITELCPGPPDLIVSGINGGLNAGINVLYSGTVAAAIEGAFFGITSVAVSLEYDAHARFDQAARLARTVIQQILEKKGPEPQLYNLNIPTAALRRTPEVSIVPMDVTRYGDKFEKRTDPWGREYYWLTGEPPAATAGHETDLSALAKGHVTLTPLDYNMTRKSVLREMQSWQFRLADSRSDDGPEDEAGPPRPVTKAARRMYQVAPGRRGR
jgi:5'-nucleotidase